MLKWKRKVKGMLLGQEGQAEKKTDRSAERLAFSNGHRDQ
jgi:hypothetical protein